MQRLNTVFVTSLLIACGDNLPEATPSADSSATDVESGSHTSPPHTSTTSSVTDPTSATDCPDDVTCVDTFPTVVSGDTQKGSSRFDSYDCAPDTDESGPEHVYRVDLPEAGFLSLDLIDVASGAVTQHWQNHFAAFGGQNVTQILQDYTEESIIRVYNQADGSLSNFTGLAEIAACFKGLFASLYDTSELAAPRSAGDVGAFSLDAGLPKLKAPNKPPKSPPEADVS